MALVSQDFQGLKAKHQAMGLIFDELANGIYFIKTPTATSWRFSSRLIPRCSKIQAPWIPPGACR